VAISFSPIAECEDTQPFAECHGISLSVNLSAGDIETIRNGLLQHGLLLFRNQLDINPLDEVNFNQAFGWHDPDQQVYLFGFGAPTTEHQVSGGAQMPEFPQISVLGNVLLDDYHGITNTQLQLRLGFTYSGWHADGLHDMFDGMPELTTMFNPPGYCATKGGETYFTSGVCAVARMETELLRELECCVVAYMRCPNDDEPYESRRVAPGPSVMVNEGTRRVGFAMDMDDPGAGMHDFELLPEHADGGGKHRCIRSHPQTGQKSLYITPGRAVCLLDAGTGEIRHGVEETADYLSRALEPSVVPGTRYEHKWREGDFVAWINPLVLHSASDPAGTEGNRLLHRVRLSTTKSRWVDGKYLYV
jgi:alpha-ketoglutarate-dependent taurine dioxygenase